MFVPLAAVHQRANGFQRMLGVFQLHGGPISFVLCDTKKQPTFKFFPFGLRRVTTGWLHGVVRYWPLMTMAGLTFGGSGMTILRGADAGNGSRATQDEGADGFEVQHQSPIRRLDGHGDPCDSRGHDGGAPLAGVGRAAEDDPASRE